MRHFIRSLALGLAAAAALVTGATADPLKISIGVQQTGTVSWELTAMQNLGIDKKHNLELDIRQLADNQAGQVALQSGAVDIILSDVVFVALQREQGNPMTMVPHSLAVGGLMVAPDSGIKSVADLKGQTIAVAGTPVDKNWVVLQAYYNQQTGGTLSNDATIKFGAPPLVNELIIGGQVKAALNNWNWNVRSAAAGDQQILGVQEMLKKLGVSQTPPLLGWVFKDETAKAKADAIKAFLDASFETKQALLTNDDVWNGIRDLTGVKDDDKLFVAMRDAYRLGVVKSYDPTHMEAATQSFDLLAKYGGPDAVGGAKELPAGTFYAGYTK